MAEADSASSQRQKQSDRDDLLHRPLYIYDLPADVLSSLSLQTEDGASSPLSLDQQPEEQSSEAAAAASAVTAIAGGAQACSLCGLSFSSVADQKSHLKSDWHHYNLKLKIRGQKPVAPEAEFEKLLGELDESLSGSDSDDSDDDTTSTSAAAADSTLAALLKKHAALADKRSPRRSDADTQGGDDGEGSNNRRAARGTPPLLWFASSLLPDNTYFGMYRAIFTPEELQTPAQVEAAVRRRQLPPIAMPKPGAANEYKGPHIFMCMMGGGHFAAMVVALAPRKPSSKHSGATPLNREATVLAHKTFHRYTTRRKQGGSQAANDNAKGAAHSAGSTLRRYNEQALVDDIRALLLDWRTLVDTSDLLFVRANGTINKRTLFGPYEGQVMHANDARLRGFPFTTRRATQAELMRSFIELTRLKVRERVLEAAKPGPNAAAAAAAASAAPTSSAPPRPPSPPKLTEEEETAQLHTSQMQALVRRSKLPALLTYLKNNSLSPDFRLLLQPPKHQEANHHAPTLLHLAASLNSAPLVSGLLSRAGADPTIRNGEDRTAFELAGDRPTRDAFRVARAELGEQAWAWDDDGARVPPPLSREEAALRDERERQKEAARRKAEEDKAREENPPSAGQRRRKGLLDGLAAGKTAEERREEEMRGLTPEQKLRIERERRARAAEERLRRMHQG